MISLTCTQCRQQLEMDDAFAGGVCRCQHCGTIQTVPSRRADRPDAPEVQKPQSSKALYKKSSSGGQQPGTGLDELAEIVASSGLARKGLSKSAPPASDKKPGVVDYVSHPGAKPSFRSNPMLPLLIGAGALVVVLLVVVLYLAVRGSSTTTRVPVRSVSTQPSPTPTAIPAAPSFVDVPLPAGPIVYAIDRSQANDEFFEMVKAAVYKSVLSLGPYRKFQIIFWHRTDEGIVAYPPDGLASVTKSEVDAAMKAFEDVVCYGTTDLKPTLEAALQSNPAAIVLTTAKGFTLDEENVEMVKQVVGAAPVKIHTIALGDAESEVLKRIAEHTGGQYSEVGQKQLRDFAH